MFSDKATSVVGFLKMVSLLSVAYATQPLGTFHQRSLELLEGETRQAAYLLNSLKIINL